VGSRAGLDVCEKSRPHWVSIPRPSSLYSVATPTELPPPPPTHTHTHTHTMYLSYGNEVSGFIKCVQILAQLRNY
jgi:hypothetical protein